MKKASPHSIPILTQLHQPSMSVKPLGTVWTATIYTPAVKRGGVRRWFEVRNDGDYAIQ